MDNIDFKLEEQAAFLDKWENDIGIKTISVPPDIDYALSLTYNQLEKLTPEQCAHYAYVLSEYALYIQKLNNRESAKYKSINHEIGKLVAPKLSQYEYISHEMKVHLIAKENTVVEGLFKRLNLQEQKLERLSFVSSHIKHLSDALNNVHRAKKTWQTH